MLDIYLIDRINILTQARDEWGVLSETVQTNIKARSEDENKIIVDRDGKEVFSEGYLIIDRLAILDYDCKIQIRSINGVEQDRKDKKYSILKLNKAHGIGAIGEHWEVHI